MFLNARHISQGLISNHNDSMLHIKSCQNMYLKNLLTEWYLLQFKSYYLN